MRILLSVAGPIPAATEDAMDERQDEHHAEDMQERAAKVARVFGFDEECQCAECGAGIPADRFSSFCTACSARRAGL